MAKRLFEVDYKKIFSPKTIQNLKGKSRQSYQDLTGNKSLQALMRDTQSLLFKIIKAEKEYKDELEMVAVQIVEDAYPIVDYANIKIEAEIVSMGDLNIEVSSNEEEVTPDFGEDDPEKMKENFLRFLVEDAELDF